MEVDPLTPYLFVLTMEALTCFIEREGGGDISPGLSLVEGVVMVC